MSSVLKSPSHRRLGDRFALRGASLLELMVGIAIGLMVLVGAISTLALNKNTSGTVADTSVLTNQANNTLRVITFHVRQAGLFEFIPTGAPNTYLLDDPPSSPVEPPSKTEILSGQNGIGPNGSDVLTVWAANRSPTVSRDCQGNTVPNVGALMRNQFFLGGTANSELMCRGAVNDTAQALASNVEDFQVQYFQENPAGTAYRWVPAGSVTNWQAVTAVDICLQLRGDVRHPLSMIPASQGCGNQSVNQDGFLRAVVRQVVQLRNRSTSL